MRGEVRLAPQGVVGHGLWAGQGSWWHACPVPAVLNAPASQSRPPESAAPQRHLPARPATHLGSVAALDVAERRVRVHNAGVTPAGAPQGAGGCGRGVKTWSGGRTKCSCWRQAAAVLATTSCICNDPDQQWWQRQALTGF